MTPVAVSNQSIDGGSSNVAKDFTITAPVNYHQRIRMKSETDTDGDTQIEFSDNVEIDVPADELWVFISDPRNLVTCVPGANQVERISEREYSCEITKGISHVTVSLSADIELVELNEPKWVVAKGKAYDSTTGTDFEGLAGMEMTEIDGETTTLAYTAEMSFTGGLASFGARFVRRVIASDVRTYFENVKRDVEGGG